MIVQILVAYLIALVACADTNSSLAYRRLLPCIQNNILMTRKADTISIPDDLSFHFEQVLNKTSIYRGLPYHGDTGNLDL